MGERRFLIHGAVSQAARRPATSPRRTGIVTEQQRVQVQAILGDASLTASEKQTLVEAVKAGAMFDLAQFSAHRRQPAMPGVAVGGPALRAHGGRLRLGASEQPRMPGIAVGGPALRAHAGPRRHGATEQPRMPGIAIGTAAR